MVCVGLAISFGIYTNFLNSIIKVPEYYTSYSMWRANAQHGGGISSYLFTLPFTISIPARILYAQISPPPVPTLTNITYNYYWMGTIVWFLSIPVFVRTVINGIKSHSNELLPLKMVIMFFLTFMLAAQSIAFSELHALGGRLLGIILIVYGLEKQPKPFSIIASRMVLIAVFLVFSYATIKLFLLS